MFLELYSASVITIMFVTAVVVWIRDERRRRRNRRAPTVSTVTVSAHVPFPHARIRNAERRARYLNTAARR